MSGALIDFQRQEMLIWSISCWRSPLIFLPRCPWGQENKPLHKLSLPGMSRWLIRGCRCISAEGQKYTGGAECHYLPRWAAVRWERPSWALACRRIFAKCWGRESINAFLDDWEKLKSRLCDGALGGKQTNNISGKRWSFLVATSCWSTGCLLPNTKRSSLQRARTRPEAGATVHLSGGGQWPEAESQDGCRLQLLQDKLKPTEHLCRYFLSNLTALSWAV